MLNLLGAGASGGGRKPGTPTIGTATAGVEQASVEFTAPSYLGKPSNNNIYTATSSPGGITGTGTSSPITVTGLSAGTSYTFTVTLSTRTSDNNSIISTSDASQSSNSVTPTAPGPFFPPFFPFFPFFPPFFPFFPPFFPFFPFFPPFFPFFSFKCVHEDTMIQTPTGLRAAKDIAIGDTVYSVNLSELPNEDIDSNEIPFINFESATLTSNSGLVETTIVSASPMTRDSYMYFNNEETIRFSTEQPMFVKKDDTYELMPSGLVEEGDYLIKIDDDGNIVETLVEQITIVEEESNMYLFNCEPQDWFIVNGYLVHNK